MIYLPQVELILSVEFGAFLQMYTPVWPPLQ